MRYLFIIDNLSTGGAQRQMVNLAVGLKKRGHAVTFFKYAPGELLAGPLKEAGIEVISHIKTSRYSPGVILALRRAIRQTRCDLMLSFLTTPNVYALFASRLLPRRPRVVISERFYDPQEGVGKLEEFFRQFYRLADHLVVNSNHQRLNFSRSYPWIRNRLTTIYNGYDLQGFRPLDKLATDSPLKLLIIASVSPYKNGLVAIRALHELKTRYGLCPKLDWIGQRVMAGERLIYLRQMEAALQEYGLEDQWRWLDQRTDIVEQLNNHDLLIHPSFGEGLPNVVCEALACGRPVILSNTLDHPNLVRDGQNGYLFDYRDPLELAEKIKTFHELSPAQKMKMGQNARSFAIENLSLEHFINAYEKLFYNLLPER